MIVRWSGDLDFTHLSVQQTASMESQRLLRRLGGRSSRVEQSPQRSGHRVRHRQSDRPSPGAGRTRDRDRAGPRSGTRGGSALRRHPFRSDRTTTIRPTRPGSSVGCDHTGGQPSSPSTHADLARSRSLPGSWRLPRRHRVLPGIRGSRSRNRTRGHRGQYGHRSSEASTADGPFPPRDDCTDSATPRDTLGNSRCCRGASPGSSHPSQALLEVLAGLRQALAHTSALRVRA